MIYTGGMEITAEQYDKIKDVLPAQRGNVEIDNITFLNALLYIAENGCKWRALPERFGKWNTVYRRLDRWAKNGVIEKLFDKMRKERILTAKTDLTALVPRGVKVRPDAAKKRSSSRSKAARRPGGKNSPDRRR
jgi:transposase